MKGVEYLLPEITCSSNMNSAFVAKDTRLQGIVGVAVGVESEFLKEFDALFIINIGFIDFL
jgi:hypothetical protein